MSKIKVLEQLLVEKYQAYIKNTTIYQQQLTVEIEKNHLLVFCQEMQKQSDFQFDQLMDVCVVDYLSYGVDSWETEETTFTGFSRGVEVQEPKIEQGGSRFAVVYHLLSTIHNHRLRIKVAIDESSLTVPSINVIWNAANWFEREAFDLFGIIFEGHPDLRRILTDYGFVGHPFRKDFPLIGTVEPRYDATLQRIVYEPVSIEERTLVPKVIRRDHRYENESVTAKESR